MNRIRIIVTIKMKLTYDTFTTSYNVVLDLLHDRGYTNIKECVDSEDEFYSVLNEQDMITLNATSEEKYCFVFWFSKPIELNRMKKVIKIIDEVKTTKRKKGILISLGWTPKVKNIVTVEQSELFDVFTLEEMQYNPTKHLLVPEQKVLTDEEKVEFLETYDLKQEQLPKIHVTDRIACWYDWKIGDVVREDDEGVITYCEVDSPGL